MAELITVPLRTAKPIDKIFIGKVDHYHISTSEGDKELWANVKDVNTNELYICDAISKIGDPFFALFKQGKRERCKIIPMDDILFIVHDRRRDKHSKLTIEKGDKDGSVQIQ